MLSTQMVGMLITSGVVVGVLATMLIGFPFLKKKGLDVPKVLDTTESVIKAAEPIINITSTLMPGNPAVDVLKTIEKWAVIAVGQAQQLYHAGTIDKDNRKQIAEDAVYKVLQELNIELTDSKKTLINAAIENAVNDLGHKDSTEAEKQVAMEKVQAEKTQLVAENTTLKTAITQFNATTASTVQASTQTVQ